MVTTRQASVLIQRSSCSARYCSRKAISSFVTRARPTVCLQAQLIRAFQLMIHMWDWDSNIGDAEGLILQKRETVTFGDMFPTSRKYLVAFMGKVCEIWADYPWWWRHEDRSKRWEELTQSQCIKSHKIRILSCWPDIVALDQQEVRSAFHFCG